MNHYLLLLLSISAFSFCATNRSLVPSLQDLCVHAVVKHKLDKYLHPQTLQKELTDEYKQRLNNRLWTVACQNMYHPNEVKAILVQGAEEEERSQGHLLRHITEWSYEDAHFYTDLDFKTYHRSTLVAKHLIEAGSICLPECFFNVCRTGNQDLFNMLQQKFHPDKELRWKQHSDGRYSYYYARADDSWKSRIDDAGNTIFHIAAFRPDRVDFCKTLLTKHAKWKDILHKNMYDQTVLEALIASHNPDKIRLAQAYFRLMQNYLLPVTATEQIVDSSAFLYEYFKSTELGGNILYNLGLD